MSGASACSNGLCRFCQALARELKTGATEIARCPSIVLATAGRDISPRERS